VIVVELFPTSQKFPAFIARRGISTTSLHQMFSAKVKPGILNIKLSILFTGHDVPTANYMATLLSSVLKRNLPVPFVVAITQHLPTRAKFLAADKGQLALIHPSSAEPARPHINHPMHYAHQGQKPN
jgi:hypothetical protein